MGWWSKNVEETLQQFFTTKNGLDNKDALARLQKYGPNRLPSKKPRPQWLRFLDQFSSPIILLLAIAGIVKLFLHQLGDSFAIFFVLFFNALLGYIQEKRSETSLQTLFKLSALRAKVLRNGTVIEIPSEDVVVGDILVLGSGAKVSADARLIESHSLEVNESQLTGESQSVSKDANLVLQENTSLFNRKNCVFTGSTIARGRGLAVVTATGSHSEVATIVLQTQTAESPPSPLERRMKDFAHMTALGTLSLVVLIIFCGHFLGYSLTDLIMTSVSLAISAVPEGLPIAITIVLAHGLILMARKQAVVRKLDAVETLGCTTIICTDKTGTLTENRMTVGKTIFGLGDGQTWALRIATYCSESRADEAVGDPIDRALMEYAKNHGFSEAGWKTELSVPYESEKQMMACRIERDGFCHTVWKGSHEAIRAQCTMMWHGNATVPYDDTVVAGNVRALANEGLKVICLAYGTEGTEGLIFAGIVGLIDPPRSEARHAIETCRKAGIRVVMLTGDDPRTAIAVAKECGLVQEEIPNYCTGEDLQALDDEALVVQLRRTCIFARIVPSQKQRIISLLQRDGAVVAMTGDGVNDAPSLKQADIGIAMGNGTDVAKEVSAMVILNNSLLTIVDAIRQGRVIFRSLQQTVVYLITTCFGGVLTIAASIFLGLPLPILPLQLLWINLVTDGTTTIPLSLEGEHGNTMNGPPRKKSSPFISAEMFRRSLLAAGIMMVGTCGVFDWIWNVRHGSLEYARTMAFTTLAFFQILNTLNSRSVRRSLFFTFSSHTKQPLHPIPFLENRWLLLVITFCSLLQILAIELPWLQTVLGTTELSWSDWFVVIGISSLVIVGVEIQKAVRFFCFS